MNRSIASLFLALSLSACAAAENPEARARADEAVKATLGQRMDEYEAALLSGDEAAIASFWSADAIIREPGMRLQGAAELEKHLATFFGGGGRISAVDIRRDNIYVHGDVAYEFGEYEETYTNAGESASARNYYAVRWQKDPAGKWVFGYLHAGARDAVQ